MTEVLCYNKGCGKNFDPANNNEGSCRYHTGGPIFHDALKGWSCCRKRSTDFTEFLNIPGCTTGLHSNVKPAAPDKDAPGPIGENEIIYTPPPQIIKPAEDVIRPSCEEPMVRLPTTVAASLKTALAKQLQDMSIQDDNQKDDASGTEVKIGESCKNSACNKTYLGAESILETCVHHTGVPIFHEGMKYWSCCQRKTSDFDNFLAQEGCTEGRHLWFKKESAETKVACRHDWHQTAMFVTISVFAKVCIPEKTWIETNQVSTKIYITFDKGNSIFEQHIELRGIIDPSKSSVKLLGSKVEINLRKGEPGSWSSLSLEPAKVTKVESDEES